MAADNDPGADAAAADWRGQLHLAEDFAVLYADIGDAAAHRHYCHQVVRGSAVSAWTEHGALSGECLLIASQLRHRLQINTQRCWLVFAEPLAFAAEDLLQAVAQAPAQLPAIVRAVQDARRPRPLDPRVAATLERIDALLGERVQAAALAREAALSLSQLERLFSAQVELPVRRLILWRRLRLALALAWSGDSLTQAAHAAGFADSAHLSRSMRSLFGLSPSRALRGLRRQP
ncbi:helix-turn-helix domain-containing protein [Pseudomonas sp. CGJS7]|uniref:helix-turn-helix domain-containing protein n=1 Tax=Pseudomonas sp. CGJS7 TaxID=3109348 RepID=UPI00300814A7